MGMAAKRRKRRKKNTENTLQGGEDVLFDLEVGAAKINEQAVLDAASTQITE